jgi:microcompartment protein CcmK/EutM
MNCVDPVLEVPADEEVAAPVVGAGLVVDWEVLVWASAAPLTRAVDTRNTAAVFEIIISSSGGAAPWRRMP